MCDHKQAGGIGFKDLKTFNDALLAKQGYRIMQEQYISQQSLFWIQN